MQGGGSLEGITLYSILYYEKSIFKGSYRGMNFRIYKEGDEDNKVLAAVAWKGPFILVFQTIRRLLIYYIPVTN